MDQRLKNERINLILKLLMAILFTTGAIIFSYPFLAHGMRMKDQWLILNMEFISVRSRLKWTVICSRRSIG